MRKTAIVVPCYNEAERLSPAAFLDFVERIRDVIFFFVDDGSTDATRRIIAGLCRRKPESFFCIALPKNSGKAAAVRTGMMAALGEAVDFVGYWDADLSTPLNEIAEFCEIIQKPGVDLVLGARVKLLGRRIERLAVRHYLGRFFATFASMVLGLAVYDTQCGAKLFRRTPQLTQALSLPFYVNWSFDVELLARLQIIGGHDGKEPLENAAVEYPLKEWVHRSGSKIGSVDFLRAVGELGRLAVCLHMPFFARRYACRLLERENAGMKDLHQQKTKWVQTWHAAASDLKEIKAKELQRTDYYEKNRVLLDEMLQYACQKATVRRNSGLVEQQRLFMKLRSKTSEKESRNYSAAKKNHGSRLNPFLGTVFWVCAIALVASVCLLAAVPPVSKDALTQHLAVPKLYLKHGFQEMPDVMTSYFPMNLDVLYLIPLALGSDIVPKYIHFAFGLMTAGLIFAFLRRRVPPVYAGFGALFFLSLPIVVQLSITVYVDLGVVFFSTAALLDLLQWREDPLRPGRLVRAAVFCGLAMGTKYNGLVLWFLLTLSVPLLYLKSGNGPGGRRRQLRAAGWAVVFASVALIVFSPWMVRNYIWTHNPVYPLFDHHFNAPKAGPPGPAAVSGEDPDAGMRSPERRGRLSHFDLRRINYDESWLEIALLPVRIFFEGRDGDPRYFDGVVNPLLFFLPFLAFIFGRADSAALRLEKRMLLGFSILWILIVFFQEVMRIRWIAPVLPPLVILSTLGLYASLQTLQSASNRFGRRLGAGVLAAAAIAALSFNAAYIVRQFGVVAPFSYLSGRLDRHAYIAHFRREYPAIRYANAHLNADARILALFLGRRLYYSDHPLVFDPEILKRSLQTADSPAGMARSLQKDGISHLMVRHDLFVDWADRNFSKEKRRLLQQFFRERLRFLYAKHNYGLYAVE